MKKKRLSCDFSGYYILTRYDLITDDWEIVEAEYDWDKIIKDKILCVFSDHDDDQVLGYLKSLTDSTDEKYNFWTTNGVPFVNCKPFNPADFNIVKDLNEYKK